MDYLIVSAVAFLASALTLFSGFGLGTLLMPAVALFFPLPLAIALTEVVHLLNNLFKLLLLGRRADKAVLFRFGVPAVLSALIGATMLDWLTNLPPLYNYEYSGKMFAVLPVKAVLGAIILVFVGLELTPRFSALRVDSKFLPLGGLLSGFFGGLSGHQGAFRSMFLLKAGMGKETFVATGVVIAVMVDVARLVIYGSGLPAWDKLDQSGILVSATLSAFLGAYLGAKLLEKVTIVSIQRAVSLLLAVIAAGLVIGVI